MTLATGESTTVKIEVEPPHLLIVFDRRCDYFVMPWQDAYSLADTLELAMGDIKDYLITASRAQLLAEASQVKLKGVTQGKLKGCVALFFEHSDRLKFSWPTAMLFHKAFKLQAQDAQMACKGIHFVYTQDGLVKELHNLKLDTVQIIPGR